MSEYTYKGLEKRAEAMACAICDNTTADILPTIPDLEIRALVEARLIKEGKITP